MFRYISKAVQDFQDSLFFYMSDFMSQEMVPDAYNYTKSFGLWKGKARKLNLNIIFSL